MCDFQEIILVSGSNWTLFTSFLCDLLGPWLTKTNAKKGILIQWKYQKLGIGISLGASRMARMPTHTLDKHHKFQYAIRVAACLRAINSIEQRNPLVWTISPPPKQLNYLRRSFPEKSLAVLTKLRRYQRMCWLVTLDGRLEEWEVELPLPFWRYPSHEN